MNRTARGYGFVSSAAIRFRIGNLRGLWSDAGRASISVWRRHVLQSRKGKPRRGAETVSDASCSLICEVSVSSALWRFLSLDEGSPHKCSAVFVLVAHYCPLIGQVNFDVIPPWSDPAIRQNKRSIISTGYFYK